MILTERQAIEALEIIAESLSFIRLEADTIRAGFGPESLYITADMIGEGCMLAFNGVTLASKKTVFTEFVKLARKHAAKELGRLRFLAKVAEEKG